MIIGITGPTGSGKTTLLSILQQQGALILDCDAIYHDLLKTDAVLLQAIGDRFPGCVTDGCLDRKKLGAIVFSDGDGLQDLNRITHSFVRQAVLSKLKNAPRLIAIDAIGLFEGGLAELCDVTVAVTADENIRIARLIHRDGISEEYAKMRIRSQKAPAEYAKACSYVLENNGTEADFRNKCLAFFHNLGIMEL